MAANDYYNSQQPHRTPCEDYRNAPLPPVPRTYSNSPYSSTTHLAQPYSPTYSTSGRHDDPYEDDNSIPLSGRKKHESATSISPLWQQNSQQQQEDDPFVRDADPRRKRSVGRRKDGWFSGQITWVVFTLTVIQLAVFIAQLAKNGRQGHFLQTHGILTRYC